VLPTDTLELPEDVRPSVRASHAVCINGESVNVMPVFRHLENIISQDEYLPENVEEVTGIPAATIRTLAREYATTKPGMIIIGMGLNHRLHGDLTIRSVLLLSALAGQYGVPGSGVGIYSGQHHFRIDISNFWWPEGKKPNVVPLHYFVMGQPTETIHPKIKYPKNGFKAMIVSHANPMVTEFSKPLRDAVDRLDLFVAIDFSMSPTCEYADVVLPAPTFWEKYDLVGTGCHPYLQIQQPVIPPQHDSKTEFWMVQELVKRVAPELYPYFDMTDEDAIRLLLETGGHETEGITLEQLKAGPVRLHVPDPEIGMDEQLINKKPFPPRAIPFKVEQQKEFHKTGRMEFFKEEEIYWKMGEAFPVFKPAFSHLPVEDQRMPLAIVTPHSKWRVHSTHSNNPLLLNINRRPVVEMHPMDAIARNIRDGDEVEVFNRNGSFRLWALLTETIKPGVVCLDHGWWDRYLADGKYHGVHTHQKIKPTHEAYFLPAVYAPGQHWKDTRVDVRRVEKSSSNGKER
jgi:nitrate reductase / nitrite oxidoreductase, alpha subunit